MFKNTLTAISLLLAAVCASCTGGGNGYRDGSDSARVADSLARLEALRAEALRADSLRRDSVIRAALATLPDFEEVLAHQRNAAFFEQRGFDVETRHEANDGDGRDMTYITARYSHIEGVTCLYEDRVFGFRYAITGADTVLRRFYDDAGRWLSDRKATGDPASAYWTVFKKGDTITVDLP